jgi:hypothetical protein
MSSIQERTADTIERQAFAIENIVNHLRMGHGLPQSSGQSPDTADEDTLHDMEPAQRRDQEAPMEAMPSHEDSLSPRFSETNEPTFHDTDTKPKHRVIRKRRKTAAEKAAMAAASDGKPLLPREEIMTIIHTMRDDGATYDQIAKHLVDLGQPTFSGRGEWHAQTIHRLCSRK